MAQSVFKTVIARYKTILENQNEWIKPSFKKPQYDLVWNRDYSLTQNCFSVNTLNGRVKLPYFAEGMSEYFNHSIYKFGTAKLVNKHGKYYLHIPVTYEMCIRDREADSVRKLADAVMNTCEGCCAVFSRNEDGSYKYAMGEIDGDLRQYTKEMNAALNGRGGGKPFFVQGSVQATEAEIRNFFEK